MSEIMFPGNLGSPHASRGLQVARGAVANRPLDLDGYDKAEGGYSARTIFAILNRHRLLIASCIVVTTALTAAIAFALTPSYQAEAMVILDTRQHDIVQSPVMLSNLVSGSMADPAIVRSEVALLNSQAYARKVIDKLDLLHNPEFQRENTPSAVAEKIRAVMTYVRKVADTDVTSSDLDAAQDEIGKAIVAFQHHLSVYNDDRSYAINIRYESHDPVFATKVVNTLAALYISDQLDNRTRVAHRASDWLKERLAVLEANAQASARKVAEFEQQNHVETVLTGNVTEQRLHELTMQQLAAADDMQRKQAILTQAQAMLHSPGGAAAAAQVLSSPLIQKLREQEAEAAARIAPLRSFYATAYPNGDPRTQEFNSRIAAEVQRIMSSLQEDVNAAKIRVDALQTAIRQEQARFDTVNAARVELVQLQHEAAAKQSLFDTFLVRSQQVEADAQSLDAGARVLQAEPPVSPSFPKKGLLIGFGFFASCFMAVLAAFIAEQIDETIRTPEDAALLTGAPTLGIVPRVRNVSQALSMVVGAPQSLFRDSINTILIALRASDRMRSFRVVAFSSAVPDEGKTLIAAAVARAAATTGSRTLLIDCDMRRPGIGTLLGDRKTSALEAMFQEKSTDIARFVKRDEGSGLYYLPTGAVKGNPQDLLGSEWMTALFARARREYDLVILDTPPLLTVSDALLLSRLTEVTLLVVRWGHTPGSLVSDALRQLQLHGKGSLGTILSMVDMRKYHQYKRSGAYFGKYFNQKATATGIF